MRLGAASLLLSLSATCVLACSTQQASLGGVQQGPVADAGTGGAGAGGTAATGGAAGGSSGGASGSSGTAGSGGTTGVACELSIYDVRGEWHGWSHKNGPATVFLKDDGVTFYWEVRTPEALAGCVRVDAMWGWYVIDQDRISVELGGGNSHTETCDDTANNVADHALTADQVETYQTDDWDRALYMTSDGDLMRGTGFLRDEGCPPELYGTWRATEPERDGTVSHYIHRWSANGDYFESRVTEFPLGYADPYREGCTETYEALGNYSDLGNQRFLATYTEETIGRTGCVEVGGNQTPETKPGTRPDQEFYYDLDAARLFLYGDKWRR
ncbi:MAG: hypothetical protein AB7K71_27600 [Polyangiaceae bacterium]